ncbi:MAG: response regulator transcription factor [Chitinophagaceae bacterium]|nr:response regulator transcription factor [Chitinophagaceae bacterium]
MDDHILLRDALAGLIEKMPGFSVSFTADHGRQMIEKLQQHEIPLVVILDISMPEMNGYETAAWLKENHPDILILILTMFDAEMPLIRLLQEGVKGFLRKDIHPDELRHALNSLLQEGYYYPVQTVGRIVNLFHQNGGSKSRYETKALSAPDIEFLKLACTDLSYKEIALQLNMSPKVIDNLRENLFARFNVKSRVGLAIYAVKNGIVQL